MKTGKFLLVLLCAALVSAMVLPVNTHAAEYEYYFRGLKISSGTPLAPDYLYSVVSGPVEYVYLDFNPPAPDTRLYVTLSESAENVKLSVDGRVDITLENLTMTGESKAIDLGGGFNGSLLLKGSNTLISSGENPALNIYHGAHASIRQATAEPAFLLAKGGPINPGIRVGRYTDVDGTVIYGVLEIWSGTVTAMSGVEGSGGTGGAGIGGLNGESGGVINIHGGVVTAIGDKSAGIGGGNRSANGGKITINGGTVIAVGGNEGAGIGGGDDDSDGGEITISGGFVTAVGGSLAAGIGGGNNGTSGVITITGGTVIANGGGGGAGIGGGNHNNNEGGNVNSIQIHGGVIFASGKDGGEDIGRGNGATEEIGAVAIHAGQEDSNPPAVFLRNNTLFEWTWIDADGYTNVGPKDYAGISAYGIELSSLYPDTPPAITGTLPAGVDGLGANWLTSLWTNQRNHWSQALQAGAYLQLKAICYFESSQSPGDVFTQSQHKGTAGKVLSLNDTGFSTPAGYTFETWKTSANTTFNPGKDYTFTGGLNLYASWTANTYSVHYDANGGDGGSMADTVHTYDAAAPLRENAFTRAGYSFAGWATTSDGDVVYSDKQSVKNLAESGAVTLYASWTANTYSVHYDANGGDGGSMADTVHTYDAAAPLRENAFTRAGYSFAGWATTSDGDVVYSDKQSVKNLAESGAVTLYASWTANTYSVHYDANGGDGGSMADTVHTYDAAAPLRENAFTRAGYSFAGWATTSGGDVVYSDKQSVKNLAESGAVTLYASWTANTYSVHYDANSGDGGSMADTVHTYDAAAPLRENAFTRAGYSFNGWATAPDGDAVYSDKQSVKNLAESGAATLYAKWTAIHYTIAYDLAGGAVSPDNPAGYTIEESADITLTNPTKTGYTFAGWTGTGITGAPVMTVTIPKGSTGDRAYTANWTAIVITGLPSSFEMYVGESVTWDPKPEDGTWNWDSGFFSAAFNSPATFTALRPGTSVITYTVNGAAHSVAVTVRQEEPPYTGQRAAWIWALASLAAVCGAGTAVKRLKKG